MKLPSEPAIKSTIPSKPSGKTEGMDLSAINKPANTGQTQVIEVGKLTTEQAKQLLQQLNNTWAKVESSQPIKQEQNSQLLAAAQKPSGEINQTLKPSGLLQQSLKQLPQQLSNQQQSLAELKLSLVKLSTEQGLLSLISTKHYSKHQAVFITQDANGKLLLQLPSEKFSLANMAAQLSIGKQIPPSQPLPQQWPLKHLLSMPPLPSSVLNTQNPITAQSVQHAIQQSGHFFEGNLNRSLNTTSQPNQVNASVPNSFTNTHSPATNLNQTLQTVSQSIKQWTQQFTERLQSHSKSQSQSQLNVEPKSPALTESTKTSLPQSETNSTSRTPLTAGLFTQLQNKPLASQTKIQPQLATQNPSSGFKPVASELTGSLMNSTLQTAESTLPKAALQVLQQDQKLWLQTGQSQLTQALNQHLMQNTESFVPNWSNALGQLKTPLDLTNWLNILVAPKPVKSEQGLNIWPSNLSSQNQLHQTLTLLLANSPTNEQSEAQQALRQLLSLSQSLMKVQHDQLQSRLQPASSEQQHLQLNLPYVHQQQLHWADFEYQSMAQEMSSQEKTLGWHLILRFAQDTHQAFAIESQLKQEQTNIVLWATEKEQLKNLNGEMPILREKLIQAGFKLESITTKHGSPARLNKPLQQSLVDIHT